MFRTSIRAVLLLVLAGAALWIAVAVSVAGVFRESKPDWALRWADFDAGARARKASDLMQGDLSPDSQAKARQFALSALQRDPTNVVAIRTLGLLASIDKDENEARPLFVYAQKRSRRDLITQIWFINEQVAHGNVAGALRHFDIALRTSKGAPQILFPILIKATSEDAVADGLTNILAAKPLWWRPFAVKLTVNGQSLSNIVKVTRGLLDPDEPRDRPILDALFARLVAEHQYDLAWAVYRGAVPADRDARLIRNGDFQQDNDLAPFGWTYLDEPDLAAVRDTRDDLTPNLALHLIASNGRGGEVARQLLRLPPGRYRISLTVDNNTPDAPWNRPTLSARCAARTSARFLSMDLPGAPGARRRVGATFTVPTECSAQWLSFTARSGTDAETRAWVDDLVIVHD